MVIRKGWAYFKLKVDDLGFWVVVGVFITLLGVSGLLGDVYQWASNQFLWSIFLLGLNSAIVVRAQQKMRSLK